MKKINNLGVKRIATSKQIISAGLTLGVGMVALPFIPFKKARNYKTFRNK